MTAPPHSFDTENVDSDYAHDALTRQKHGLMQMLLIGEWQVNMEAD